MDNQNPRDKREDTDQSAPDANEPDHMDQEKGKGHGPLKGTDTQATTDAAYAERERGKRTTM